MKSSPLHIELTSSQALNLFHGRKFKLKRNSIIYYIEKQQARFTKFGRDYVVSDWFGNELNIELIGVY